MTFAEACEILKGRYRTHREAARNLNISYEHYCALRSGRAHISKRTAEFIILKAKTVAPQEQPVAHATPANHDDPGMSLPNSGQSVTV
ncbi:hypothetical protein [Desulfovibrio sp. ZJ200]|uniref:hypothetical protein n=1 Tax=Desulfovibrio sp. ZJ200 TaxID=2709792 RepID=UPI0013EB3AC1|nr:hypothetical protein [Desulfovibrio sp. ZJ200]